MRCGHAADVSLAPTEPPEYGAAALTPAPRAWDLEDFGATAAKSVLLAGQPKRVRIELAWPAWKEWLTPWLWGLLCSSLPLMTLRAPRDRVLLHAWPVLGAGTAGSHRWASRRWPDITSGTPSRIGTAANTAIGPRELKPLPTQCWTSTLNRHQSNPHVCARRGTRRRRNPPARRPPPSPRGRRHPNGGHPVPQG